ncbi:unnamed protein product [Dovyalis caffra]|uniref:RPW8 domain-containing protein n=1 Tax=Dovyalis caffra TaxID=77055 RepID=A0AAV1RSV9_9ROSI|nr:unnamed protein product [Dovyalis caffra]
MTCFNFACLFWLEWEALQAALRMGIVGLQGSFSSSWQQPFYIRWLIKINGKSTVIHSHGYIVFRWKVLLIGGVTHVRNKGCGYITGRGCDFCTGLGCGFVTDWGCRTATGWSWRAEPVLRFGLQQCCLFGLFYGYWMVLGNCCWAEPVLGCGVWICYCWKSALCVVAILDLSLGYWASLGYAGPGLEDVLEESAALETAMAAAFIGGAALGAVFGELLKAVLDVKDKALMFRSNLETMEDILQSIIPILQDIDQLNKALDGRKEETEKIMKVIRKAEKLVLKCTKIHRYNYWEKSRYTNKLLKLEGSLKLFFQIIMQGQTARDVKKILVEVTGKHSSRGRKIGFYASSAVPEPPANPVGSELVLEELKMELFKDGVSMVVLSAPPGCGKTTLAKLLCHDKEVQGKFQDNIFYVIASKNASMEGVVRRLFKHRGLDVGDFQSDEDVVYQLEQFLKNIGPSPILLVLDDVWPGSESLLENFKFQIPDYKILVTSRSDFPRFGSTYKLQPLNYDDSLTLFCNSAFLPDQSAKIADEDVVSKIVKGCKGFPLALKVVGKSLCGEPAEIWKTRATELSKVGSIFEYSDLLNSLQRSLDALDKKVIVKECFMDLCSFPEDQRIPVNALIDMWMELYKLDEEAYAVAKIQELSNRNLVDLVVTRDDLSGCYNHHFAMQHDLLRELTIHQSELEPIEQKKRLVLEIHANNVPDWWMEQKKPSISSRLLSISTDENFSSSWCSMQAPEVEVLVLNCQTKNYTLPEFIAGMEKLKVLIFMNHGSLPTEFSNFQLLASVPNLKRIRLEQVSIPSFAFTSTKLENIQKLSLFMCNIGQAFGTSTILVSEALPNLVEINIDYSNDLIELPGEICHLIKLRNISITNCHKLIALPREIGKLVNLEILRLGSCIELLELPHTIGGLHNLNILDISECLEIERLPEEIGEVQNLSMLHMIGCSNIHELPPSIVNLKYLKEVVCDEETADLWEPVRHVLENLRIKVHKEDINLDWLDNHRF